MKQEKPKPSYRYSFRLDELDNLKMIELFEKSELDNFSVFARDRIFNTPFKVTTHDASAVDFYVRLTHVNAQVHKINTLYTQAKNAINTFHSETAASILLKNTTIPQQRIVEILEEISKLIEEMRNIRLWK